MLLMACFLGLYDLAKIELERNKVLNLLGLKTYVNRGCGRTGWTPLQLACQTGAEELVKLLMESGAEPGLQNSLLITALEIATIRKGDGILRLLASTKSGNNILHQGSLNFGPCAKALLFAAAVGNEECCRFLIERYGFSVNPPNKYSSPLNRAIKRGHLNLARTLVEEWHAKTENHALLLRSVSAIQENNIALDAYHLLLQEWGVDINGVDEQGCNVICHIFRDEEKIHDFQFSLETILQLGADAGHRNNYGYTALHCAILVDRFPDLIVRHRILELSSQNGQLHINQKTLYGDTILHLFVCRLIVISNAKRKSSVAVEAISFSSHGPAALKVLIDFGVDKNIKDDSGGTTLEKLRQGLCDVKIGKWEREGYRDFAALAQKLIYILESYVPAM